MCGIQFLPCRTNVNRPCGPWNEHLSSNCILLWYLSVLLGVLSLEKLQNITTFDLCLCLCLILSFEPVFTVVAVKR